MNENITVYYVNVSSNKVTSVKIYKEVMPYEKNTGIKQKGGLRFER